MHGAGNDYVYVNCFNEHIEDPNELSRFVSDRHFGIGSDGLVLIMPSETCDFRMRMFNADGSEAEMCGNATRCVGKYVYDHRLTAKKEFTLETLAGVKVLQLFTNADNQVERVRVDMGAPILEAAEIPVIAPAAAAGDDSATLSSPVVNLPVEVLGEVKELTCVSMGNPHAICYVDDVAALNLPAIGPAYEHHAIFPRRTNTEFVQVVDRTRVKMRVWERGAGETLACGTGCCATLVACVLCGKTDRHATIEVLGGELDIEWDEQSGHVFMTGPATTVFDGTLQWQPRG
jgi:diaminopimelate epimerase